MLKKILFACLLLSCLPSAGVASGMPADTTDSLLGVNEGWSWPIVVIAPPGGWETEQGESVKAAMRAAEREVSRNRDAIRGREVTFMFSSIANSAELVERIRVWRSMKVDIIVSFGDDAINDSLQYLCRDDGPSVLFSSGENLSLTNRLQGKPYPYLFALDFPYTSRANALAEMVASENPPQNAAILTDMMSPKLAHGAALNASFLKSRKIPVIDLSVAGFRQDQFIPQVRDAESAGIHNFFSWLDAMATLSIWRTAHRSGKGSTVYYAGDRHRILLDAEGLLLVDKDVLLERNEKGKHDIMIKIRDLFNRVPADPVTAAKAYALGRWTIEAYRHTHDVDNAAIAKALANAGGIPLMDELLSINARTHRPVTRKFGVLRVTAGEFGSYGAVEVFSGEIVE